MSWSTDPFLHVCITTIKRWNSVNPKNRLRQGMETEVTRAMAEHLNRRHFGLTNNEVRYDHLLEGYEVPREFILAHGHMRKRTPDKKTTIRADLACWAKSQLSIMELKILDEDDKKPGEHLNKMVYELLADYGKCNTLEGLARFPIAFWQLALIMNPRPHNAEAAKEVHERIVSNGLVRGRNTVKTDSIKTTAGEALGLFARSHGGDVTVRNLAIDGRKHRLIVIGKVFAASRQPRRAKC